MEEASEEVYKGVAAPKRKRVEEEPTVTEIPKVGGAGGGGGMVEAGEWFRRGAAEPHFPPPLPSPTPPQPIHPPDTPTPQWLEISEEDDEKTRERKKKLLKSYKSKIRFQNLDMKVKEKQGNWQQFLKGKGGKQKAGFMTGKKKTSMVRKGRAG